MVSMCWSTKYLRERNPPWKERKKRWKKNNNVNENVNEKIENIRTCASHTVRVSQASSRRDNSTGSICSFKYGISCFWKQVYWWIPFANIEGWGWLSFISQQVWGNCRLTKGYSTGLRCQVRSFTLWHSCHNIRFIFSRNNYRLPTIEECSVKKLPKIPVDFRSSKIQPGETYQQFSIRLGRRFEQWLESSSINPFYSSLKDFMIFDKNTCRPSPQTFAPLKRNEGCTC